MRPDQIPSQFKRQVHCTRDCGRRARHVRRQRSGEPRVTSDGRYLLSFVPGRFSGHGPSQNGSWIPDHRLVVEASIGRELRSDEHVHHRNRDTRDNRIENLEVLGRDEHLKLHGALKRGVPRPEIRMPRRACAWCGEPVKHTKKTVKTCSRQCGGLLKHHGPDAAPVKGGSGRRPDPQAAVPWDLRRAAILAPST
jgi:HNH endonuclease